MLHFLILLLIAGVCGCIAQAIAGFSRGGCLVSIVIGFIGAIVGMGLQRLTGLPDIWYYDGFPIIWSIIGGVIFAVIVGLITRRPPSA